MNSNVRNSDVLRRVRTYPSSPRRFDPHTASQEELLRYGFPRRPDPEKEPQLARLWKRVFARPIRFVEAKVAIDPVMSNRNPLIGGSALGPQLAPGEFDQPGWAGVVKYMDMSQGSDFTQPATMVFGQWQVPSVPAITPNEVMRLGIWVGLDGADTGELLQAGVAAVVSPPPWWWPFGSTSVEWYAWTEWYTGEYQDPPVIRNLPVAQGDEIFVVVCAPQPDFGFVSMTNISRGVGVSVGVPAPHQDIVSGGYTAEWIVEAPTRHMPIFSPVTFSDCTAGSSPAGIFNLTGGFTTDIPDPSSPQEFPPHLTQTSIASPTIAVVKQLKTDWF
jgi:Peptidase A4 family